MNVNSVVVSGNLTRDPELRHTQSGTPVCSLRIAHNDRAKISGEWQDVANYFDVVVWGNQGEACANYLSKGRGVVVQGRLSWREWETREGGKRQSVEIVAERVQWLPGRDGDGGDRSYGDRPRENREAASREEFAGAPRADEAFVGQGTDDSDIPF